MAMLSSENSRTAFSPFAGCATAGFARKPKAIGEQGRGERPTLGDTGISSAAATVAPDQVLPYRAEARPTVTRITAI